MSKNQLLLLLFLTKWQEIRRLSKLSLGHKILNHESFTYLCPPGFYGDNICNHFSFLQGFRQKQGGVDCLAGMVVISNRSRYDRFL